MALYNDAGYIKGLICDTSDKTLTNTELGNCYDFEFADRN